MGKTDYITAIEISSSKISGTVGVNTYEGITILAAASTPVEGFISRGVVRNVDETSNAINHIINSLEEKLDNISIKRAYISLAGLTVQSIRSKVTREFDEYTKITPEIINEIAEENDRLFKAPEGYKIVRVINQEYRLDGKIDSNPIGAPTRHIEGNFLNIVIKEQYLKQLNDSFAQAEIEIEDSFCAARLDAEIIASKDARRNGCAIVNIGADTTTVTIYKNDMMRKLVVLPLGSNNITMDLCSLHISKDEAEEIKITRGYKSQNSDMDNLDNDTVNNVIKARMNEILANVRYQIEESGETVGHVILTGGGSNLKNLELLLNEYLPNFKCEIISEPQFSLVCSSGVNISGIFSTALYSLLKLGNKNCCEENKPAVYTPPVEQTLKFDDDTRENDEKETFEEEVKKNEPKNEPKKTTKKTQKSKDSSWGFGTLFGKIAEGAKNFVGEITSEDDVDDNEDDN